MYNLADLSSEDSTARKAVSESDLRVIYDSDDNVLFGTQMIKGKVMYKYLPAELMDTGRPYIVLTQVNYDGRGNADLPEGASTIAFNDLPNMFTDNTFGE